MKHIRFPVAFGPNGYIGMAASEDIPPNKAIIAIPNKLLITTLMIHDSELKPIIEEYSEFFDNDDDDDSDFNTLCLFIMR